MREGFPSMNSRRPFTALLATVAPIALAATFNFPVANAAIHQHAPSYGVLSRAQGGDLAPRAATSGQTSSRTSRDSFGWYWIYLVQTFGPNSTIAGLTASSQGIKVTASVVGTNLRTRFAAANYNPATKSLGKAQPASAPAPYNGDIVLDWNNAYNHAHFVGVQHVSITVNGKEIVPWPKAITVYGDASQTEASGAVDNQIIGKSGDYLWIAMKGPATAPFSLPVYFRFRNWNRLMAINVKTGIYYVYDLPPLTSPTDASNTIPAFSMHDGHVYIGLSDWLGVFPANPDNPASSASSSGSATSTKTKATQISAPANRPTPSAPVIVEPVPASVMSARETLAETDLAALVRQEAGSIAYDWDKTIMNKDVPGVTGTMSAWLSDGAYINHGWLPMGLMYGATFPMPSTSLYAKKQRALVRELTALGKNPLPTAGYALNTPAKERIHFHSAPPATLPGYIIKNHLYVPNTRTWPLPPAFRTYADVFQSVGPLLAQKSLYPVFIPRPVGADSADNYWANVKYSVDGNGYDLQVYAGNKLPANAKSILGGEANMDFELHGQALNVPAPMDYRWNMNVALSHAKVQKVSLGRGIIAELYTQAGSKSTLMTRSIQWKENGWTWGMETSYPNQNLVTAAKQEVAEIAPLVLPAPTGRGVFSFGADAPSEIAFTFMNARYYLYSTGFRAPALAAALTDLSAY